MTEPLHIFLPHGTDAAAPIWFVTAETWPAIRARLTPPERAFADTAGFEPDAGNHLLLPGEAGALSGALFALEKPGKAAANAFLPGSSR